MNLNTRPSRSARRAALAPQQPARAGRRPRLTKQTAIVAVIAQLLAVVGIIAVTSSPASANPAPVMTGYVPLPADEFQAALAEANSGAGTTIDFTVAFTNAAAGSIITYDQWEDGFEADLANPTQSSTLVFGDSSTGNGNAATYCARCTGDTLPQGATLKMRNNISTPRSSGTTRFDGGDKIASTRGFAITAGGYTTSVGSLLASVVASYDTSKYSTAYTVPVGTDTPSPSGTTNANGVASVLVQAAQDGTVVQVDRDGDGTSDVSRTIGQGKATRVNALKEGATVRSSAPVQVQLFTGDPTQSYEARSYTLFPDSVLSSDYLSPAGSNTNSFRTINYLYNPHDTDLTVTPTCTGCSGTITVAANASAAFASPTGKGVRFASDDGRTFIGIAGVGAQSGAAPGGSGDDSSTWDWGFSMIPTSQLTSQVVLGWAPGNSNADPSTPSGNRDDDPVWVTTLTATTLYVDLDGDPSTGSITANDCFGAKHDRDISVAALASTRIYDSTDGDMTSARIYTCDGTKVAGAWGEDSANAPAGSPGFDAGYTIIPTTTMLVDKTGALGNDLDEDGAFGPGDTITYEIAIADAGSLAFTGVKASDELPAGLTYVPDSTTLTDGDGTVADIPDDVVPTAATVFPLDETGTELPDIGAGDTVYLHFDARIDAPFPVDSGSIGNEACVTASEASACDQTTTELVEADLNLTKAITDAPAFIGDQVTYLLTVSSAGPDAASGVEVTDQLGADLGFVSATASQGTYDELTGTWDVGDLAAGTSATLSIVATADAADIANLAEITNSGAYDPDSQPAEDVLGPGPNQDDEAEADLADLPVRVDAVDDTYSTAYKTPLTTTAPGVLGNDSGTSITVTGHTSPAHGSLTQNADGSFTYTPSTGFRGTDSYTYTITGPAGTDTATVTIKVAGPDEPVAVDDAYTTPFETVLTTPAPGVMGNDTAVGGQVTDHTDPAHGTLVQNDDGSFTYTPDARFFGEDTYEYELSDETNQSTSATVRITVEAPEAPTADDDAHTTGYEQLLTVDPAGVLGNDTGTDIEVFDHTQGGHGSVTMQADGSFTYLPDPGFVGDDTFTYTIRDLAGQEATATVTVTVDPPAAPTATDDATSTPFETPITVVAPGVLGNDTGTAISVLDHTDPGHGTVTVDPDGSFTYTPDAGFVGDDTFTYTVVDEVGQEATATVTITVDPPAAPVAVDDEHTTPYETPITVDAPGVLGNDTGTRIGVTGWSQPAHGTLDIALDGSFTYTPDAGFTGDEVVTYDIVDAAEQATSATLTIHVAKPGAPVASDDAYTTPYATALVVPAAGILGNDSGTGITVTDHGSPSHGSLTQGADGSLTYTPVSGFAGEDSYTYEITDEVGQTATATVTITVEPPAVPLAVDDDYATPYETQLTVVAPGVMGNDAGEDIAVISYSAPLHGSAFITDSGALTYTPDAGFHGVDHVDYTIEDAVGQTVSATVTITVAKPDAPAAADDAHTTAYATPVTVDAPGVLGNDSGTGITVTSVATPGHGTVTIDPDGTMTYTPDDGFTGTDAFDYTITDETGQTATATVTITVDPPAAPTATDDDYATPYETPITVDAPGILGNDSGTGLTVGSHTDPSHGTVTVAADGTMTYTPEDGFAGTDTFTYAALDEVGQTVEATVTIEVGAPAGPTAVDDDYTTPYETSLVVDAPGILGNDSGEWIAVVDHSAPGHGSVTTQIDGSLVYLPDAGFTGTDSFTYTITDAFEQSATATVTVTVDPPAAPDAVDDATSTAYQTPVTVDAPGILGNDTGTGIELQSYGQPGHGTVTVSPDGSFTYTPADGFAGVDSFDYVIVDEVGQEATATVTITVGEPDGPVATDDAYTTPYETDLVVDPSGILGNDDGTKIAVTGHSDPAHGTVTVGDDGSLTYVPEPGFTGLDSFTYEITDGFDRTSTATVRITVDPPAAPEAIDDGYTTPFETSITVDAPGILGNDAGTGISVALHGGPGHGSVTVDADGSLTYTPDAGFAGDDSFTYGIVDEVGQTATATVTITVDQPAAPTAADDAYATPYETALVVDPSGILGNDAGTAITVSDHGDPSHGTVTVGADGSLTYTPDAGFAGDDSFTYEIADVVGQTATATVTITVERPAAPQADDDVDSTPYQTPLAISAPGLLGNDTGTDIEVLDHTAPAHGTVTVEPDGSLTYTPDDGFTGDDSFEYTIVDPWGREATATVTITVGKPGAPIAVDDAYETPFQTPYVLAATGILGNDSGTAIRVATHTDPANGIVAVGSDGSMTYTPADGFAGMDSFTYTIADEVGQEATATVTITVVPPAAPEAVDDAYTTPFETSITVDAPGILANDSGTQITVDLHGDPSHGTVEVAADGTITYTPDAGFTGEDAFTYGIVDQLGRTAEATVTITVAPPGAPVAADDAYTTPYQTVLEVAGPGIVGNDTGEALTVTSHTDPSHGTVDVAADGTITYTPEDGFTGTDTFTYVVTDLASQTATATVTIVVSPPDGPVARPDEGTTPYQTALVVQAPGALGNDSGTGITVTGHTDPAHGTLELGPDGTWVYTPEDGFTGVDSVTYTIVDEVGQEAQSTITITVDPPAAPVATDDEFQGEYDTPLVIDPTELLVNDTGTAITVTITTQPFNGTVVVDPDGTITYTPNPGYTGTDEFTYTIADETGQEATAIVRITVPGPTTTTTEATTTTTTEASTTSTSAPTTSTTVAVSDTSAATPPPATDSGTIARTGSDVTRWVAPALAMLAAGGILVLLARRRRLA